jgi:hypothetical protein
MSDTFCSICSIDFYSVYCLKTHLKSKKHFNKVNCIEGFPCECGKKYKSSQARYTHRLKCTLYQDLKQKNNKNTNMSSTVENHDNNRILELEKDAQIKDLQHENEKLKYKLEIAELKEKIANTTKVTNNNNDNSKNKTINNITNVTINAFGEEKIDYITDEKKIKYCKEVYKSFKTYLNDVHFNPEHPENHNIKLQNKKEKMCLIMENNNKWKYVPKDKLYEDLKDKAYDALADTYNEYISKFDPRNRDRFEEFVKKYNSDNEKTVRAINKKIDKDIDVLFLEAKNNLK